MEHAIGNTNVILPAIWSELRDSEKWQIGQSYSVLYSEGKKEVAIGLKKALVKVRGFDFVPETLRSQTFISAANDVLIAHTNFDNFYNETRPMEVLASLGTSIPMPAFPQCLSATLAVYLGNAYGYSYKAAEPARRIIRGLSANQWTYYLNQCLPHDKMILEKIAFYKLPLDRWIDLISALDENNLIINNKQVSRLINSGRRKQKTQAMDQAQALLSDAYGKKVNNIN